MYCTNELTALATSLALQDAILASYFTIATSGYVMLIDFFYRVAAALPTLCGHYEHYLYKEFSYGYFPAFPFESGPSDVGKVT